MFVHVENDANLSGNAARDRAQTIEENGPDVPGGSHLATIPSGTQNEAVFSLRVDTGNIIRAGDPWIGLFRAPPTTPDSRPTGWQWVTGGPMIYTNWHPFGNTPLTTAEYYVHLYDGGDRWNDNDGSGVFPNRSVPRFIAERDAGADNVLAGTPGNDRLTGGAGRDALTGGAGNDRLGGDKGDDLISGGNGDDEIDGGAGTDRLRGGKQDDVQRADGGADRVLGQGGNDRLDGGSGRDDLRRAPALCCAALSLDLRAVLRHTVRVQTRSDPMTFLNTLSRAVTWWNGSTFGTQLFTARHGIRVGEDAAGNVFYRSKDSKRRWVIFNGAPEASRVSPDWHGWLHHTWDETPADRPLPHKVWQKPHQPNLTGTPMAYVPPGSLRRTNPVERRDYEPWTPE